MKVDWSPGRPRYGARMLVFLVAVAAVGSAIFWESLRSRPKGRDRPPETAFSLREYPPGGEVCGGFCLHPLPCGDRRDLPPAPDGPLPRARSRRRPSTRGDEASGRPLFEAQGLEYSIENRDGHVIHQETRRDASGRIIARNEAEVQFVLGSGRQGLAYLIERDGFLFQSPITWYARERRWDLSPGYEKSNTSTSTGRSMPACLFCHANRVEPVAGTVNRYQPPIFQGHAIGCERCHGPGELHVAASRGRRRPGHDDRQPRRTWSPRSGTPSASNAT